MHDTSDEGDTPDLATAYVEAVLQDDEVVKCRQEFVETLAEKLLTYALGRGLETYDRPAVREIRRRVESQDYRFSALVDAIVDSVPFRLRRIPEI